MTAMTTKQVYVVSDGTGETALTMIRAALVQYPDQPINLVRCKNVRTETQLEPLIEEMDPEHSFVVYTVVSGKLRQSIENLCTSKGLLCVDLLGPLLNQLSLFLKVQGHESQPGRLRLVNEDYFKKIEAIEFTVKHDDGKLLSGLAEADIVLVGISRTSKTPLSIFLSHKGLKVANVPLVLNQPLPDELFSIDQRKIVGLIVDNEILTRIRRNRLERFGQDPGGSYASPSYVQKEIEYAYEIFRKNRRWPVFNVTDRALEETAAEILRVVANRFSWFELI